MLDTYNCYTADYCANIGLLQGGELCPLLFTYYADESINIYFKDYMSAEYTVNDKKGNVSHYNIEGKYCYSTFI